MASNNQDFITKYGLPAGYQYTNFILNDSVLEFYCNDLNLPSKIKDWVKEFGNENCVEWRLFYKTKPSVKKFRYIYKIEYRCQYSDQRMRRKILTKRKPKSTSCPATILFTVIRSSKCVNTQTKIVIKNEHNDETGMAETTLKYIDVDNLTKEKLKNLFLHGFSQASAHFTLKLDTLINFNEDYRVLVDRSKVPDLKYCYNLFSKFKKEFGNIKISSEDIKSQFEHLCQETHWNGHATFDLNGSIFTLTIMTPLMKRVHLNIPESKKLVYIESKDNFVDKNIDTIYFIYTQTEIGALPLGYVITSSRILSVFEKALKQFCSLDKDDISFFRRGTILGPENVVIDNSLERSIVKKIWPNCKVLLNTNYVLCSVWQWLSDRKHNIRENDRKVLFVNFKNIMTSGSCEDILCSYNKLMSVHTLRQCPGFYNYFNSTWWPVKESWCLCYRKYLIQIEKEVMQCNQYAFRVLKDIFLNYFKVYNTFQLIELVTSRLDNYYSKRITDILIDKVDFSNIKTFLPDSEEISSEKILHIDENNFLIKNCDSEDFIGDLELNVCTCDIGISGALCKHQGAVLLNKKLMLPWDYSDSSRAVLIYIAKGEAIIENTTQLFSGSEIFSNDDMNTENHFEIGDAELCNTEDNSSNDLDLIESITSQETLQTYRNEEDQQTLIYKKLQSIFEDIQMRVKHNPSEQMTDACRTFCQNYENSCQDVQSLQAALCTFGKSEQFIKQTFNNQLAVKRKLPTTNQKATNVSPNKLIKIRSNENQVILIVE